MGERYTTQVISGYNATPPSDDGASTEANRLKWSTIKTKLNDPAINQITAIQAAIIEELDQSVQDKSAAFTVTSAEHNQTINVTAAADITLGDAATLGEGFVVRIKNSHTAAITVDRATGTDTIDGAAADDAIVPNGSNIYVTNGAGFLKLGSAYPVLDEDDLSSDSDIHVPTQQSVKAYVDANQFPTGTWTPESTFATGYNLQEGRYTRIGNKVFIEGAIGISTASGASNTITGLPYTSNSSEPRGSITVYQWSSLDQTPATVFGFIPLNSTSITLRWTDGVVASPLTTSLLYTGSYVWFTGSYTV